MTGELALVREAGAQGDLRQGQVRPCLQELLGPLDATQDHVLVRRQPRVNALNFLYIRSTGEDFREKHGVLSSQLAFAGDALFGGMALKHT